VPGLIGLAVVLLVFALVTYILGTQGIEGLSMNIAKRLAIIFVVLAIISYIF